MFWRPLRCNHYPYSSLFRSRKDHARFTQGSPKWNFSGKKWERILLFVLLNTGNASGGYCFSSLELGTGRAVIGLYVNGNSCGFSNQVYWAVDTMNQYCFYPFRLSILSLSWLLSIVTTRTELKGEKYSVLLFVETHSCQKDFAIHSIPPFLKMDLKIDCKTFPQSPVPFFFKRSIVWDLSHTTQDDVKPFIP